jgi:hypothetical protein
MSLRQVVQELQSGGTGVKVDNGFAITPFTITLRA